MHYVNDLHGSCLQHGNREHVPFKKSCRVKLLFVEDVTFIYKSFGFVNRCEINLNRSMACITCSHPLTMIFVEQFVSFWDLKSKIDFWFFTLKIPPSLFIWSVPKYGCIMGPNGKTIVVPKFKKISWYQNIFSKKMWYQLIIKKTKKKSVGTTFCFSFGTMVPIGWKWLDT